MKTILLVEDNPDEEQLMLRAFRENRISNPVDVVHDGVEAMDYLLAAVAVDKLPALVLLDLKLPRMDGLEVLERVRAHGRLKNLPVVVMTSSRGERDILKSYALGANSYIRKPVDFEQFAGAVRQLGRYWLLLNEPPFPEEKIQMTGKDKQ